MVKQLAIKTENCRNSSADKSWAGVLFPEFIRFIREQSRDSCFGRRQPGSGRVPHCDVVTARPGFQRQIPDMGLLAGGNTPCRGGLQDPFELPA